MSKEVINNMLCHLKQVIGANKQKQEVLDAENILEIIKNEDTSKKEIQLGYIINSIMTKIAKKSKLRIKLTIVFRFLKDNYAKNVIPLLQHKSITPTMKNHSKSNFCVVVVIENKSK